ncbi:acetoacetate-CoA ligase [Atractiella rhizophila]|nr:acetoacetate-CoA ligase [Atractiella rhizophila]
MRVNEVGKRRRRIYSPNCSSSIQPNSMSTSRAKAWRIPTAQEIESSQFTKLINFVNERHGLKLDGYWELHRWSLEESNDFWRAIWDFRGLIGEVGGGLFFDGSKPMWPPYNTMPNLRLNFSENILLAHRNARSKDRIAVVNCIEPTPGHSKPRTLKSLSWAQLYDEVFWTSAALKSSCGLKERDVVACFGPNNAEAIVAVLATASFGGIFSSSATEFGAKAVLERFEQISPKVIFTADKRQYAGKIVDIYPKLLEILKSLPTVQHVVVVGQMEQNRSPKSLPTADDQLKGVKFWKYDEFLAAGRKSASVAGKTEIQFWRGPAYSPLWILYSSGTTGKPKSIVHTSGGMILASAAAGFHTETHAGSALMQFSTLAWMMWNASVMNMINGTRIIAYEGSPLIPTSILWDLVEEHKVTYVGLSPRYLQVLQQQGYLPNKKHDLSALECALTAGSPLKPELYDFIRDHISSTMQLANGSGGTDICGAFIGGCSILPVYQAGQIQVPYLAMDVQAWDDKGNSVWDRQGNMICTRPFPNMPMQFWGDAKHERLRSSYFDSYSHKIVWDHSDWIERFSDGGGYVIYGRSDGVLNPGGVRFGSAELYDAFENLEEIQDSIAVGQKLGDGDERVILFVKTAGDRELDQNIVNAIRQNIVEKLSRRHLPAKIVQCPAIPYTVNMKKMEVAVKKLVNGVRLSDLNVSSCENPQSLSFFVDHPDINLKTVRSRL